MSSSTQRTVVITGVGAERGIGRATAHRFARDAVHAAELPVVGAVLNIAGITSPVPFLETTLELWNKIFAVNATGTYLVTKAFLPDFIRPRASEPSIACAVDVVTGKEL